MLRIQASRNPIDYLLMTISEVNAVAHTNVSAVVSTVMPASGDDEVCFRGCVPRTCEVVGEGVSRHLQCYTYCAAHLEHSLNMLYVTHMMCTIVFIVVPMLQVRWAARREIAERGLNDNKPYSLLQYQEKCHMLASYAYESWGGSYVEDFVEVILSFAVVVCFSIVSPTMLIIGFIAQIFEYRLLVYRMMWITCRPFPAGSEGLDEWFIVLDVILYVAICMNSLLLLCVLRTDLDTVGAMEKLVVVVIVILTLTVVKVVLRVNMHEKPRELVEATDHNCEFVETLRLLRSKGQTLVRAPPHDHVRIGVRGE